MAKQIVEYKNGKVVIKSSPKDGDNIAVFVRPGDKIEIQIPGFNMDDADIQLLGGDITIETPNGGLLTFVSMALMAYGDKAPIFNTQQNKSVTLDTIIGQIENINSLPIDSVMTTDEVEIVEEASVENSEEDSEPVESLASAVAKIMQQVEEVKPQEDPTPKHKFDSEPTETPQVETNPIIDDSNPPVSKGTPQNAAVEGVKPTLSFDINIQHTEIREFGSLQIDGGGGVSYENDFDKKKDSTEENDIDPSKLIDQTKAEIIDYSYITGDDGIDNMVINANDSIDFKDGYTSRKITIDPAQPEGFALDTITISGLPTDVSIKNAVNLGGGIFRLNRSVDGSDGFEIDETSGSVDLIITYSTSLEVTFELKIEALSQFSLDNVSEEHKGEIEQPIITSIKAEVGYGINIKDVASGYQFDSFNGFPYKQGFVLLTNLNDNIIKTGDVDTKVNGSDQRDVVIAQNGDDVIKTLDGDDTITAGFGDDIVDGGNGVDTLDFINSTVNINVNLSNTSIQDTNEGNDTFINMENINGSNNFDTLIGDNNNNAIFGNSGFDIINGLKGNDYLDGGSGKDTLQGGFGQQRKFPQIPQPLALLKISRKEVTSTWKPVIPAAWFNMLISLQIYTISAKYIIFFELFLNYF